MKKFFSIALVLLFMSSVLVSYAQAKTHTNMATSINGYFAKIFADLKSATDQDPSVSNFREIMKPIVKNTEGFFGATLIDPDFVIRQVYNPVNFLARGFDLKKVKELTYFYKLMQEDPAPQLSEPGHGSIFQPRLIAMRYPVIKNGKLKNIVSMMVQTKSFLKATGLDKCSAFKIICLGKLTELKGKLSKDYKEITLKLPSTEWVIQYDD